MNWLKRLRTYYKTRHYKGFRAIDGWLTDAEAHTLYVLAGQLPPKACVVEIGSWQGKSTCCLAKGLKDGTIHAIDPFDASGETTSAKLYAEKSSQQQESLLGLFESNVAKNGIKDKIKLCQGFSKDYAEAFEAIDLLFIDGDHSLEGCLYDFKTFAPKIKPGGFLLFHDYHPGRDDLGTNHVIEQNVRPSGDWQLVKQADSLIAFRKNV